jgi:uncharacterized membrane protein HdeD (DUF308 family)
MALALVIAAWLVLDGVSSLMIALDLRRKGRASWGWSAVSAVVDWLLAVGIFVLAPLGGVLVVGVVVGIDLIFGGGALLMVAAAARHTREGAAGPA